MPSFFGRVTSPLVGSISPVKNLHQRGFTRAIGPSYRVAPSCEETWLLTSSNKTLAPKRIVMLLTESKEFQL